jgi:hypothetical protein
MTARLLALGASILARLGFRLRPVLAVVPALPMTAPCPRPLALRVTRCAGLLGSPGCNREGGAP